MNDLLVCIITYPLSLKMLFFFVVIWKYPLFFFFFKEVKHIFEIAKNALILLSKVHITTSDLFMGGG